MKAATRRPGFTFVEGMIAAVIFFVVVGAGFVAYTTARKQTDRVMRLSSSLQAAFSAASRLQLDLASAWVPQDADLHSSGFRLGADGRSMGFLRGSHVDDAEAAPAGGLARKWVQWSVQPGADGGLFLRREFGATDPVVSTWDAVPIQEARFLLRKYQGELYAVGEILFEQPAASSGAPARPYPIRVVRRLRGASRLPDAAIPPPPTTVVGNLPAPEDVAEPVIPGAQVTMGGS